MTKQPSERRNIAPVLSQKLSSFLARKIAGFFLSARKLTG